MNNLIAGSGLQPKYIIADVDTYKKGPNDDIYANFPGQLRPSWTGCRGRTRTGARS